MRWVVLLGLLAGCQQIFGLSDPALGDAGAAGDSLRDVRASDASLYSSCGPASTTMIACYDFNDDVADQSANPNPTASMSVSFVPGLQGAAIVLTATSKVTIADSLRLDADAVTMEAWINPHSLPMTGARMGLWDTDGQYGMFITSGGVLACTGGSGAASSGMGVVAMNVWTHVACADGNGQVIGYINGLPALGGLLSAAIPTTPTNGAEIGGNAPDMLDRYDGEMDLLRLYRSVRTPDEICSDAHCK